MFETDATKATASGFASSLQEVLEDYQSELWGSLAIKRMLDSDGGSYRNRPHDTLKPTTCHDHCINLHKQTRNQPFGSFPVT